MNQFKTLALLALLSALLISISYFFIGGVAGLVVGILLAAVTNLGSWFYSDQIALAAYKAQPLTREQAPQLYTLVESVAQRAQIPMPAVYLVPSEAANAFATGRDPQHAAVALTEGIINLLSTDELEGVIAHELSHVRNRDTLTQAVAATIAGAISFLAQTLSYGMWSMGSSRSENNRGPNPLGLLLMVILAPLAATVIQLAISRTREFAADAGAAQITKNPRALARALERLENQGTVAPIGGNPAFTPLLIINPISGEFLSSLFATHPSTEARINNLLALESQLPKLTSN
ncbi:M48 family metalloprotease [Gloeocapsa sp. PCC 73106]|uniref:M48 family metalloprotease n=1 Tax=Gloeocapsa sp. PCC 73106 TaxID=102232 RepID=UPI0002ABF563|nr:M48 family metalloprotease [Gloeocapsa sp. PCC 73106]ELR99351.1 Zn-dependent protease with chaperone function [Gloeocapsa sp. PCC 73106]